MENLKNRIIEALENLDTPDLVEVWNDYARECYYEDVIYCMDEFNDEFQYDSPMEIARKIWHGDFNPNDRMIRRYTVSLQPMIARVYGWKIHDFTRKGKTAALPVAA